jgi:protein-tyrosine kinase
MSLIESALEKLRRSNEGEHKLPHAAPGVPASSGASASPVHVAPAKIAVVVPPTVPPADEADNTRRIKVDMEGLRKAGYLPEEGLERRFADHFRQVKRPLIERALGGPPEMRLLLVTSALPGDGKTFTSMNLTLSMARERDVTVLLVDADGPRARISSVLGLRGEPGLLDALADESVDVESLVLKTDVRGLEVLPAGRFIENATELLASARMNQIATRLAARNARRIVVFDSAPLLASSEARVLVRIPGQVVLVVKAGVTPKQAITDAVGHIDKSKMQGIVLNHAAFRQGAGYYGYGEYSEGAEAGKS